MYLLTNNNVIVIMDTGNLKLIIVVNKLDSDNNGQNGHYNDGNGRWCLCADDNGHQWRYTKPFYYYYLSSEMDLKYGVTQGSVLFGALVVYSLQRSDVYEVINYHNLNMHFYADDTQIFNPFENITTY